jgi:predicted transcriptional regulator
MTIREMVKLLGGEVVSGEDKLDKTVEDFAATDLLSDALAVEKENYALITGLTNAQILRTAEITNACCVVIVRNKQPKQPAITLARRSGIPLILSPYTMFEACCRLSPFVEKQDGGATRTSNPTDT